jgi:uncharacterized membrane protein YadS
MYRCCSFFSEVWSYFIPEVTEVIPFFILIFLMMADFSSLCDSFQDVKNGLGSATLTTLEK